jgi:hypothetical protein
MASRMLALLLVGTCLALPSRATAHGDPAAVVSVVRSDGDGAPRLLRLSEGMAARVGQHTRYLCPALFDSDETPRAAALPGGPTVVASSSGVYLLFDDGNVASHPDPSVSEGAITGLEAGENAVLALRKRVDGAELLALDAERAEVIAELPAALSSLAVEDDGVLVAGLTAAGRAAQRGFDLDGAERDEWNAEAATPLDTLAVFARVAGDLPYLLVSARNGLGSELARLDNAGGYDVVQRASGAISGPIAVGGRTWFAFDGRLAELTDGGDVVRSEQGPLVTCVGRNRTLAYACTPGALVRLEDGQLGERLFDLDQLEPPELSGLAPALAERCRLQWLRFRVDLVAAGITPNDDGGEPAPPSSGTRDGGAAVGSSQRTRARALGGEDDACSVGDVRRSGRDAGIGHWLFAGFVAAQLVRRRRRRARCQLEL